jgi:hypothetical protein
MDEAGATDASMSGSSSPAAALPRPARPARRRCPASRHREAGSSIALRRHERARDMRERIGGIAVMRMAPHERDRTGHAGGIRRSRSPCGRAWRGADSRFADRASPGGTKDAQLRATPHRRSRCPSVPGSGRRPALPIRDRRSAVASYGRLSSTQSGPCRAIVDAQLVAMSADPQPEKGRDVETALRWCAVRHGGPVSAGASEITAI